MEDSEKPIVALIKQSRIEGMSDDDIEQQLMLGTWSPLDLQYGRNFLHMTRKSTRQDSLASVELKKLERKEHFILQSQHVVHFFLHWVLPLGAILGFAALTYVFIDKFVISSLSTDVTPSVLVVDSSPNTDTSTSTPSNATITPAPDPVMSGRARVKIPGGGVMCTPDQKQCPNGENVKRVPPNCDFAVCGGSPL